MRLVYKKYADGDDVLYRTDDKGRNPEPIRGELRDRSKVSRVPIFIEVSCDDHADVIRDVRQALESIDRALPG